MRKLISLPLGIDDAWAQVEEGLALPNIWIPLSTDQYSTVLKGLLQDAQINANLFPDAHLAALAIGHCLEGCTIDTDFARFSGCRWRNPLQVAS